MGFLVRVEEVGLGDKDRLGIKDEGREKITQDGIVFRMGLDRESRNDELQVSRSKSKGEPGVVANREELIELVG